jgi:ribosomal protein S18 acetylase RimI-like enzyme
MPSEASNVRTRQFCAENPALGASIDGLVFTGSGPAVVQAISRHTGSDGTNVLSEVVNRLLVKKGADWTAVILSEYLELYSNSVGTFSLVWDNNTNQLVSHGSIFQSRSHPWAGLLAHIRTREEFKGLGLGTLVTQEVTGAAFSQGAKVVVLATDDKINRIEQGERAAYSMYSRMGYAILGEARLADTIDWLMVIDQPLFTELLAQQAKGGGRLPTQEYPSVAEAKRQLVVRTRARFAQTSASLIDPVSDGDLANLFVLLNLCPQNDFLLKLTSWQVHHGAEAERTFITTLRQAIVDQDRLQDASLVLRDEDGAAIAVCAAHQHSPFTRRTFGIDFYCLPVLLRGSHDTILDLVQRTIDRVSNSPDRPRPCRWSFVGVDLEKVRLFESLGFVATPNSTKYFGADGLVAVEAAEYVRTLG